MHHLRPSPFRVVVLNALAVVLLFTTWNVYQHALASLHTDQKNIILTLFFSAQTPREDIQSIERAGQSLDDVEFVETTYPAQAKEQFSSRFGTPSDTLLPVNPFPISMSIHFKTNSSIVPEFPALRAMSILLNNRSITNKATESKVDTTLIDRVQSTIHTLHITAPIILCVVLLITLYMLVSATRNMMALIRDEAYIMNIFGARTWDIIRTHTVRLLLFSVLGIISGSIIGIMSIVGVYILDKAVTIPSVETIIQLTTSYHRLPLLLSIDGLILCIMIVLGMIVGTRYVNKFSRM